MPIELSSFFETPKKGQIPRNFDNTKFSVRMPVSSIIIRFLRFPLLLTSVTVCLVAGTGAALCVGAVVTADFTGLFLHKAVYNGYNGTEYKNPPAGRMNSVIGSINSGITVIPNH